jgi:isopenicillin-N epimerase
VTKWQPPQPIPGARLLFSLDPGVAYLNHGSFGAVPVPVQRAQQRLRDEVEANPMRHFTDGLDERVGHTRRHLATFVGADPDGAALVANATTGVSIVLHSLGLRPGDEIVTSDHGYGAVRIAVEHACRYLGVVHQTVTLPLSPTDDEVVDAFVGAVGPRTRLAVIDQITSPTARPLPVDRVAEVLRGTGTAVLVDGAHAPGMLDAPASGHGADFWVGNFHKWAYAPRGTALLAVAPQWRPRIRPLIMSWHDAAGFPASVESVGTVDYTPWLAAPTGLFTLRSLGVETVRAHNAALASYAHEIVAAALGVPPTASGDQPRLPMRVVPLPDGVGADEPAAVALRRRISEKLRTEVAVHSWRGRGLLRLSAQVYNRAQEYDRLAEGLPELLHAG